MGADARIGDLVAGSRLGFEPAGDRELKGVPETLDAVPLVARSIRVEAIVLSLRRRVSVRRNTGQRAVPAPRTR